MMGWSPGCYIPSYVEIGLPVPEKKIFKRFLSYGHGGHLGHVRRIMSSDLHFLESESFHKKFGSDRQSSYEKIRFEFLYVQNLGPGSRNDLDLQYSHTFIYSIRCQLQLTFMSQAGIVSEKSTVFTFSHRKS